MIKFAGVDYGSKMAGTTVIAIYEEGKPIHFYQSEKKKDADSYLLQRIEEFELKEIFLDAPLSLPGRYSGVPGCEDYFYRKGDKELRAMSPMFIGALTARAMKFRDHLEEKEVIVREIYPAALAKVLNLKDLGYKKEKENISKCLEVLYGKFQFHLGQAPENWHQFDALLAVGSGLRYKLKEHIFVGDEAEGGIIF